MKKIASLFLALFSIIILSHLVKNIDREAFLKIFTNPFQSKSIVVPLPQQDSQRELESILREKKIEIVSSPTASDSAILVNLSNSETLVIFSANKDLLLQISSLQIVLNRLTIEGRKGKKIDLRFDNPVVVY